MAATISDINKELPPELLVKIFMCCNLEELVNLCGVCLLWRALINDYLCSALKYLDFTDTAQRVLKMNDSAFKGVTDIYIVIRNPNIIRNLVILLSRVQRVINLHVVWDCGDTFWVRAAVGNSKGTNRASSGVYRMLEHCKIVGNVKKQEPKPESSSDCQTSPTDALFSLKARGCLKSLSFHVKSCDYQYSFTPLLDALLSLVVHTSRGTLTSLELVALHLVSRPSQDSNRHLQRVLDLCQNLRHVTLRQCSLRYPYHGNCLQIIPALTNLTHLDLRGSFQYNDDVDLSFVEAVKSCCINIANNILLERVHVRPQNNLTMLQFIHRVQHLLLKDLDSEQLRLAIHSLNCGGDVCVEELNVIGCRDHITDDILLSLALAVRGLKELYAAWCQHVTNEGVASLVTSIPTLENINLRGVDNISDSLINLLQDVPVIFVPLEGSNRRKYYIQILAETTTLTKQMAERRSSEQQVTTGKYGNINVKFGYYLGALGDS